MRYRKMTGLKSSEPAFAQISETPLSEVLAMTGADKLFLCGSLAEMTREYCEEPLRHGWEFARSYMHKFRSPEYRRRKIEECDHSGPRERMDLCKACVEDNDERICAKIRVKLMTESWLPGCEDVKQAIYAWQTLQAEWARATGLSLLNTPSKTGQALLWESLQRGEDFPSLPDFLASHIRSIAPQHRLEVFQRDYAGDVHQYDGRWMYASLVGLDRLPIGEPEHVYDFIPYQPGWYHVRVTIPKTWDHIGLLPVKFDDRGEFEWRYPSAPGETFETWASEPELTIARSAEWYFEVIEGWRFAKGRPLASWGKKLIEMRERLRAPSAYASAAVREILNHTIGSMHVNTVEREVFISDDNWPAYVKENGFPRSHERVDGGRWVVTPVVHSDRLSIFMPHWSAQIWALERARIAQHALKCERSELIAIDGDAVYASSALPFTDNGNLGQLRIKHQGAQPDRLLRLRKGASNG